MIVFSLLCCFKPVLIFFFVWKDILYCPLKPSDSLKNNLDVSTAFMSAPGRARFAFNKDLLCLSQNIVIWTISVMLLWCVFLFVD